MNEFDEEALNDILNEFDIGPLQDTDTETNTANERNYSHQSYIGTPITETKAEGFFRLCAGNPNGLNLGIDGGDLKEYLEEMTRMQADHISLSEINLDTNQYKMNQKLYNTCQSAHDYYRLNFSSSAVPAQEEYKPGGTMSITCGSNSGRVLEGGADPMGRWTYQTLSCKDFRNLTSVTAYQVCD